MAVSVLPPAHVSKRSLSALAWRRLCWHRGKSYQGVCQRWRATARVYILALILLVWPKYPTHVHLGQALLFSHWASWKQHVRSPRAQHRELVNLSWLQTSAVSSLLLPAPGAQDRCSDPTQLLPAPTRQHARAGKPSLNQCAWQRDAEIQAGFTRSRLGKP